MKSKANSLVGVLVACAIVVLLVLVFTVGPGLFGQKSQERPDGKGETVVGKTLYRAKDEVCRSNIEQVRLALKVNTDPVENTFPDSIESTKLGSDYYKCAVGGEPYVYDKESGQVRCVHPGHEKY